MVRRWRLIGYYSILYYPLTQRRMFFHSSPQVVICLAKRQPSGEFDGGGGGKGRNTDASYDAYESNLTYCFVYLTTLGLHRLS
jgi:hypothetical protein